MEEDDVTLRGRKRPELLLGSVECSVHEFQGTKLGRRRVDDSILYITEVAVNPLFRRNGIGTTLLKVRTDRRADAVLFRL